MWWAGVVPAWHAASQGRGSAPFLARSPGSARWDDFFGNHHHNILWWKFWQEYWKWHESFYKETLEEYNHPSGVPMNWDGRRYDVPNFGFKKTVLGVLLTIYGPIVVGLGSILILLLKFIPIQLHALVRYFQLMCSCGCAGFPFWLVGIPLVVGQ